MVEALIVEDEVALQTLYTRMLEKVGYAVRCAGDGNQAIELLERDSATRLLLLDMRMPNRDGIAVIEYLQTYPQLDQMHVIIATASREFSRYVRMLPSAQFMLKPVLPRDLIPVIEQLHQHQLTSE